jgi:hypothetical protein
MGLERRRGGRLQALVCALGLGPAFAGAEPLDPQQLLDRAFANLYADDYVQKLTLSTRVASARPLDRTLQITRKQSVQPGKALVRFLAPFDVRRTSVLILENDDANDDLYVYLPALELTRRISSAQRADSFFGTDLSYEDIEPKQASDYAVRVLEGDATEACVRLEITPAEGFDSTYEAMVSCIEPARALIYWTEFRRRGKAVKRLEIDLTQVKPVKERFIPFSMTVRSLARGSETEVRTESYELVETVPESLFTTWNLEAGDARRDRSKTEPADPAR